MSHQLYNRLWRNSNDHSVLPTSSAPTSDKSSRAGSLITRRWARILGIGLVSLVFFGFFLEFQKHQTKYPPLYEEYIEYERHFPQHDPDLPFPEGKHAKFIYFGNHAHGVGWGNVLQEMILNAHLAHTLKRSFVFDNYTWGRDGPEYSKFNGKLIPSRIPLSTMITGPIIGGDLGPHSNVPRAVSREYFYKVCPNPTVIHPSEVKVKEIPDYTAAQTLDAWVEKINSIEDRCIEIPKDTDRLFDIWIMGSGKRLLDIWPSLSKSPIITKFGWSPLIQSAYKTNKHLFQPSSAAVAPASAPAVFEGLLALHIRRGDFADHCHHLARWSSEYNGFNTFADFPDRFTPLPGGGQGESTPENTDFYFEHCYPDIQQIVKKVMDIKTERRTRGQTIDRVYIMTNGPSDWLAQLRSALYAAHSWKGVGTSRDLSLSWEQKYVAQALDMFIGQWAHVFVGNGFSSLSSNVAMLRMAIDSDPQTVRFW